MLHTGPLKTLRQNAVASTRPVIKGGKQQGAMIICHHAFSKTCSKHLAATRKSTDTWQGRGKKPRKIKQWLKGTFKNTDGASCLRLMQVLLRR